MTLRKAAETVLGIVSLPFAVLLGLVYLVWIAIISVGFFLRKWRLSLTEKTERSDR